MTDAERKLISEQSQIWKALGVADDVGKFTTKQIDDYVKLATKNPKANKVILGKWNKGANTSYVSRAADNYTYFSLGEEWDNIFNLCGKNNDEMWRINKEFSKILDKIEIVSNNNIIIVINTISSYLKEKFYI